MSCIVVLAHIKEKERCYSAFLKLMKMGEEEGECTLQQFIQIFEMLLEFYLGVYVNVGFEPVVQYSDVMITPSEC